MCISLCVSVTITEEEIMESKFLHVHNNSWDRINKKIPWISENKTTNQNLWNESGAAHSWKIRTVNAYARKISYSDHEMDLVRSKARIDIEVSCSSDKG